MADHVVLRHTVLTLRGLVNRQQPNVKRYGVVALLATMSASYCEKHSRS